MDEYFQLPRAAIEKMSCESFRHAACAGMWGLAVWGGGGEGYP